MKKKIKKPKKLTPIDKLNFKIRDLEDANSTLKYQLENATSKKGALEMTLYKKDGELGFIKSQIIAVIQVMNKIDPKIASSGETHATVGNGLGRLQVALSYMDRNDKGGFSSGEISPNLIARR